MPASTPKSDFLAYGHQVICTSSPHAVRAGLKAFSDGGNAVDAALTAAICLTVVEPTMNGLGGDLMALVFNDGHVHALEAVGWSPAQSPRPPNRGELRGWSTVTIPGQVRGWSTLHKKFGQLPWAALFDPAVHYAKNGFSVGEKTAALWNSLPDDLTAQSYFKKYFLSPGAPQAGSTFKFRDVDTTLEHLAQSGGEDFYVGRIAEKIVAQAQAEGQAWTMADLSEWQPSWVQPIKSKWQNHSLFEMPPPAQGGACSLALMLFECLRGSELPFGSAQRLHLEIECMKAALAEVQIVAADFSSNQAEMLALLEPEAVRAIANKISLTQASTQYHPRHQSGGTVLMVTAYKNQVCVLIQSNFYGFGSGIVIDGYGISLHNRAVGFTMNASKRNQYSSRKKPFHTLAPAMLCDEQGPLHAFGVMGGTLQPQGQFQILNALAAQVPLAEAIRQPRWRVRDQKTVCLEQGFDLKVAEDLKDRGHQIKFEDSTQFGGAQWVSRALDNSWIGASDSRKDGLAGAQ